MANDPQAENGELPEDELSAEEVGQAENTAGDDSVGDAADPAELSEKLVQAEAQVQEHLDQLMRAKAEMDNLRKRQERDLENAHKFALENFVKELLGVWDSLELGLNAATGDSPSLGKLVEGTELTLKMLGGVMDKFGVNQINPEGQPFNPDLHQAMSMQPRNDVEPNTVVTVVQKGYTLNDRLVRPAMVMVSQAAPGGIDERA